MVLPLLLIVGIVILVGIVLLFMVFLPILKLILIVVALAMVYKLLPERVKKIENWQFALLGIGLLASIVTIGGSFGFFAVGSLPLAIQESVALAIPSPLTLFLAFLVIVEAIIIIKK